MTTKMENYSKSANILVIDDNESLCQTLKHIFKREGYGTCVARTGTEALQLMEEERFDIALLDVRLPDYDGTELLRQIERMQSDIPIIMITGYASFDSAIKSLNTNAVAYMTKPLDIEHLLKTMDDTLVKERLMRQEREVKAALRASERKFRELIENLHDIVFVIDENNHYSDYYTSDEKLLYAPPSEFLGKHIRDVLPPDVARQHLQVMSRLRSHGGIETLEYVLDSGDGEKYYSATLALHPESSHIVAGIRDISETKEAALAIKNVESLYAATIEAVDSGILVVDSAGYPMYWNKSFEDNFSFPGVELDTMRAQDIFSALKSLIENGNQFLEKAKGIQDSDMDWKTLLRYRNGTTYECYTSALAEDEEVVARVWSIRDITQLKRAEVSANLYLDLLGHDVRNHLQGIAMATDMLEWSSGEEMNKDALNALSEGVHKIARLIDKLKQTEDLSKKPLRTRRLDTAILNTVNGFRTMHKRVEIDVEIQPVEPVILADDNLEYLMSNLLENAVENNPHEQKRVWVRLERGIKGYELSVKDDGAGLSEIRRGEIFDPHRRYGGVGLHQVSQIAEKYGGFVQVRNRIPGDHSKGADFRVLFPRHNI